MLHKVIKIIKTFIQKIIPENSNFWKYIKRIYQRISIRFLKPPEIFDHDYYLVQNEDVAASNIDPYTHYMLFGYIEGRKPNPLFDPIWYLSQYPDVKAAQIEPLTHYIKYGWKDGRNPHFLFDTAFYINSYPEVLSQKYDPFTHFLLIGWKEGKKPHPEFNTEEYLLNYPHLIENQINPLLHFLALDGGEALEIEGLFPEIEHQPDSYFYRQYKNFQSLDESIKSLLKTNPLKILSLEELSKALKNALGESEYIISISQDNYLKNVGGVQIYIWDEQVAYNQNGVGYIHFSPASPYSLLVKEGEDFLLRVIANGNLIGLAESSDISQVLRGISSDGKKVQKIILHHLMGFQMEWVNSVVAEFGHNKAVFWLHDNFSICPGYRLLRNEVEYCGAPDVSSNSCKLCVYGQERKNHHVPAFQSLFTKNQISIIAPSNFILDLWQTRSNLTANEKVVIPHAKMIDDAEHQIDLDALSQRKLRIAYLGHPVYHKGWMEWKKVLERFADSDQYDFYHFGSSTNEQLPHTFVETSVTNNDRFAMIDKLKENQIDVCFLWSICPESFSFTLYEGRAAGCYVVTYKDSGNIQVTVQQDHLGEVFQTTAEFLARLESPKFSEDVRAYRTKAKTGKLVLNSKL